MKKYQINKKLRHKKTERLQAITIFSVQYQQREIN